MRGVIAMDSFKGSLTSAQAALAVQRGLEKGGIPDTCVVPVADGGEGLTLSLLRALGGKIHICDCHDAIMRPVQSKWAMLPNGTAVIEMAACAGLPLIPPELRDIMKATTYGVGEMLRDALDHGAKKIILGLGGSATNDMGLGMAQALGYCVTDAAGEEIGLGGGALSAVARIDRSDADRRINDIEIIAACDVTNPLCGENGASHVFGPQKGADAAQVEELDQALLHCANIVRRDLATDVLSVAGAGAAGGLGAGAMAFLGAKLERGFDIVARETRLAEKIAQSDFVITGEGRTDAQSAMGKVPCGVGRIAQQYGKPVLVLSGALGKGYEALYDMGVTACFSVSEGAMTLKDCMGRAEELLENHAYAVGRLMEELCR